MKNRSDYNKKIFLMIFGILFITSIFSFSVCAKEFSDKPDNLYTKHEIKNNKNIYSNKHITISSDIDNTIDLSSATINNGYVSVKSYKKNNKKETDNTYEIKYYTGNNGVKYWVWKSDLVDISPKKVKETGVLMGEYISKDGYVTYKTNGFSTIIFSFPDVIIGYRNFADINLDQYFNTSDSNFDHYYAYYNDPVNGNHLRVTSGTSSFNTDYFEVGLSNDGSYTFLNIEMYDRICNLTFCDKPYMGSTYSRYNVTISACNSDDSICDNDTMTFMTPENWNYYEYGDYAWADLRVDHVWNFNEFSQVNYYTDWITETDSSVSGATLTTGKLNNSYTFDGVNDYIDTGISENYDRMAINVWIKPDDLASGDLSTIIGRDQSGSRSLYFAIANNSGSVEPYVEIGGTIFCGGSYVANKTIDIDSWNMITFIYVEDGTYGISGVDGVGKIWVNGELAFSRSVALDFGTYSTNYEIGRRTYTGSNLYFDGEIDELVFLESPLKIDQYAVNLMYNNGFGRYFTQFYQPQKLHRYTPDYNLTLGSFDIDMRGMFNRELTGDETYVLQYYDYTDNSWHWLNQSYCTVGNTYYDVCLDSDGVATFDYNSGSSEDKYFLASIGMSSITYDTSWPYNSTDSIKTSFGIRLLEQAVTPPSLISPFPATFNITWDSNSSNNIATTGYDKYRTQGNIHFSNYETINVSYYDDDGDGNIILYTIMLDSDNDTYTGEALGNITVILDVATAPSSDMYIIVYVNENKTYGDDITFTAWNSNGSVSDTTYFYTEDAPLLPTILYFDIANQTYILNDYNEIDLTNYVTDLEYTNITFTYINGSNYTLNTPHYDVNLTGPQYPNQFTFDEFRIGLTYENVLFFYSYNDTYELELNTKLTTTNGSYGNDNFYIFIVTSLPTTVSTMGQEYLSNFNDWFLGFFPSADSLTTIQALGFVILTMLIVSIIIFSLFAMAKQNLDTALKVVIFANILLFLLFASLNYIGVGILIAVALIFLGLGYLKIRG